MHGVHDRLAQAYDLELTTTDHLPRSSIASSSLDDYSEQALRDHVDSFVLTKPSSKRTSLSGTVEAIERIAISPIQNNSISAQTHVVSGRHRKNARFGCPFQKHEPHQNRFCTVRSRRNPTGGFPNMHRVKEHLLRVHSSATARKARVSLMPKIVKEALGGCFSRGLSDESKWSSLCRLLFPNLSVENYSSPYIEANSAIYLPGLSTSRGSTPDSDLEPCTPASNSFDGTLVEGTVSNDSVQSSEMLCRNVALDVSLDRLGGQGQRENSSPTGPELNLADWIHDFPEPEWPSFISMDNVSITEREALDSRSFENSAKQAVNEAPRESYLATIPSTETGDDSRSTSMSTTNDIALIRQARDRANGQYVALFEASHSLRKDVALWTYDFEQQVFLVADPRTRERLLDKIAELVAILGKQ